MELIIKSEVNASATSTAHIAIKIDLNHLKQEPGLVQSVKSEPVLLVKEEILEDCSQTGNGQQSVQGASISAGTSSLNDACCTSLGDLLNVKQELVDLDIEPTVLHYMDVQNTINKKMSAGNGENTIVDDYNEAMPGSGVERESFEDEFIDGNEQQCVQDVSTPAGTGSMNEAYSTNLGDLLNIKQELGDLDIEPTVLQYMDIHNTINKQNMSAVKEENTIVGDCNEPMTTIKVESVEDKFTGTETMPCKHCGHVTTTEDYNMTQVKCGPGQQNGHQQHFLGQHQAMSSNDFQCNACYRVIHKPYLVSSSKISVTTSSAAGTSNPKKSEATKIKQQKRRRPYQCDICDARFVQSSALSQHTRVHTGEKPYRCDMCDARFTQSSGLSQHMRVHTGEKPYRCDMCNARFTQSSGLVNHKRVHTAEKPYQCDRCDAKFTRNTYLKGHMKIHSGNKHTSNHKTKYQCNTCDARFKRFSDLTKHKKVHTNKRCYQCDSCDAQFVRKSILSRHMRVHTGEKPYQCDNCNARFVRNSGLSQHMRVHTGEKPYKCDMCDAKFAQNGGLTQHLRIHTGEKPYQCDRCDARFTQSSGLGQHMRLHTGEKPYQCDMCGARFTQSSGLIQHKRVTTGEQPYLCDMCDARFTQICGLIQHRTQHISTLFTMF